MIEQWLLDLLVCPRCKGELTHETEPGEPQGHLAQHRQAVGAFLGLQRRGGDAPDPGHAQESLVCPRCRLRYEVRENIPILLIDEAQPLA